jgi:hypothetical protein
MRVRRRAVAIGGLAVVAVVGGFWAWRALTPADTGGALVVDPDPLVFPTARWGDRITRSFTLTNRSNRSVLVKDPAFSCACFRVDRPSPFAVFQPGQSWKFDVVMETAQSGSPGLVRKEMTIVSDDPVMPKLVVPVVGRLTAYRTIEPQSVSVGNVDPAADSPEKRVAVRAGQGFTVAVVKAESDDVRRVATDVRPVEGGADVFVRSVRGAPPGPIGVQVRLTLRIQEKDGEPETVNETVWVAGRVK